VPMYPTTVRLLPPVIAEAYQRARSADVAPMPWVKLPSTSVPALSTRLPFHVKAAVLFNVTVGVPRCCSP